jgi:putative resolvase
MWLKSKEFKKILGLSNQALYERRKKGSLKFKIVNNVYFYWLEENIETDTTRQNVIYCRVSNTKQKDDLDKQETILKEYAISNGYKVDYIFKDIASGMNENRKELNELIKLVIENKVNKVFISYKDRLTRFGYNYFEYIFKMFGVEIEVVNLTKEEDFQTELTQDLISIIHHFSMKMYSNRRKELNALKKALKQALKQENENN